MKALPLYKDPPFAPVETSAFLEDDIECDRCELHSEARHHICIPSDDGENGITSPGGILVVGEGPAREDDSEGRPLADRMGGAYLRSLVDQYYQGDVVYDLGTRCWNGTKILEEEYFDRCRPYLANTVARVEPSRVIALGPWGAYAVTGRKIRNSTCRRGYGWLYEYDSPVYFLSSPHEVRGNRFLREQFESDLEWALTAPIPKAPPFKSIVNIVETYEDALVAERDLERYPWVTFDCETSGPLFDATFTLLCVALCGKGANDTWLWGREALNNPRIAKVLARIMTNPKIKKGGQNIKFDILAIWCGLKVWCAPTVYDTRLQRKLIFAEADAKLETMAELIGMGGHKKEAQDALKLAVKELRKASTSPDEPRPALDRLPAMIEAIIRLNDTSGDTLKKWAYALLPDNILYRYNARDTLSTDRLAIHLEEELEDEPELEHHWEIGVRRAINAFARIEANGIAVSEDGVRAFNKLLKHQIDEATVKIYAYGEFNPNSTPQIREILFKKLRLRPVKKTKGTKMPSTDAASLEVLSKQHSFPGDLLTYRKLCKLKSVYAEPMITFIRADGRVHPTFNLDGARSGRGSCNEPNLQNIPRAGTPAGKMARDIFIAPPGRKLVELDYSQLELRVAAMLSGDMVMRQIFVDGHDYHQRTAELISMLKWKIEPSQVKKEHRDVAKTFNFGLLYGMTDEGLAARLKCPVEEAAMLRAAIMGKFHQLDRWIQRMLREARASGVTYTYWNGKKARRRPLYGVIDGDNRKRSNAENSSYNTPVQGSAADFCLFSLCAIIEWLEEAKLDAMVVLTVHDSIIIEVADAQVKKVINGAKRIMESWPSAGKLDVPLKADVKLGQTWGSLVEIKDSSKWREALAAGEKQ